MRTEIFGKYGHWNARNTQFTVKLQKHGTQQIMNMMAESANEIENR